MKCVMKNLWALLLLIPLFAAGQSSNYMNDAMVQAVMGAYAAQIEANPQDYNAYYSRARDYFQYGEYEKSLSDLNNAIKYFPETEKADLSQAYTLRGMILQEQGNKEQAFADFNKAVELDATSRFSLLARAHLLYEMGDYESAKTDYNIILRRDVRCQEAYLGLARIAYRNNNMGMCEEYLMKGQNSNPSNLQFYLERAELYKAMGEYDKAADDYVYAIVYGRDEMVVLTLIDFSHEAYDAVVNALSKAINDYKENGYFYYIRARVHEENYRYSASISDWNALVEGSNLNHHAVYHHRAYCYMRLGQFEYAFNDINHAIDMKSDQVAYYIMRSRLYRLMGDFDNAAADLSMAATFDPTHIEVMKQWAMMATEQGKYEEALAIYDEAILYYADDLMLYMLRADVNSKMSRNEAAEANYQIIVNFPVENAVMETWYGFALAKLGNTADAEAWIESMINPNNGVVRPEDYYYAACLYAMTGNQTMAYNRLEEALKRGYGDYYNLYFEYDLPITLAPLRNEEEFRSLIRGYSETF